MRKRSREGKKYGIAANRQNSAIVNQDLGSFIRNAQNLK
jgi:hypothetical protein